jgi:hypothetical protein
MSSVDLARYFLFTLVAIWLGPGLLGVAVGLLVTLLGPVTRIIQRLKKPYK